MPKLVRLSKEITTEYRGDPEFGEPKTVRHPNPPPQGGYFDDVIHVVLPGKDYLVSDGHAEFLKQTWGWRIEVRDAP